MLLAFRINVKLLVTQSKQRSLCKLSCLPAQPTLSHRLLCAKSSGLFASEMHSSRP
jgi:hypothetical protein